MKYFIIYSDSSSDGKASHEVECDWVNMPTESNSMIEFRKKTEDGTNRIVLAVNPANVMALELVEGTEANDGEHIYDEDDGPPDVES
jgi:hypothetical protein